ncbi:MAG: type II toxin-antitoxin system HicA family toxin [Candidatus Heimdallarchaeota archaeon]|nr:type II toxin-antitoxin system HicA family toxin [Candidatus Heimdallarchaeota archaeon]
MLEKFGFSLVRRKGSHEIYYNPSIGQRLNIQPNPRDRGKAKPYQVKQLLTIIAEYRLMEESSCQKNI